MSAPLRGERLRVRHANASRDAVRDLSLALRAGEVLVLAGPNGSGKSTALAALGRVLRPASGSVWLAEREAWGASPRAFAREVARLPQAPQAPLALTVERLIANGRHPHRRILGGGERHDAEALGAALRSLDLLDLRHRALGSLSGGESRRAWLALALCQEARVLLLDEPTAGLDLRAQWEVLELLRRLAHEDGLTIAVVLHDLEQAARIADRIAVLHRGRLYEIGPPERCLRPEMLRDVYGVAARIEKEDGAIRVQVLGPADPVRRL
jgi:iron complex transport system ATP-binding protein